MFYCIRLAVSSDAEAIISIYAPFILKTAVSFETIVPTVSEYSKRIDKISSVYPFLVYQIDDKIAGYCYASKHRERAAYLYDVDVSIYVNPEYHGKGIAFKLYSCLFEILTELGYYNAYAGYTVPNDKSKYFHKKFGFTHIGTYKSTGYKFGKWYDVAWLEKSLSIYIDKPLIPKSINEISNVRLNEIFCNIPDKHI